MRRTRTLMVPVLATLTSAAILAPAASAGGGPFGYPPEGAAGADPVAVVLAGVCLLLGAATVRPRRHRIAV